MSTSSSLPIQKILEIEPAEALGLLSGDVGYEHGHEYRAKGYQGALNTQTLLSILERPFNDNKRRCEITVGKVGFLLPKWRF